MKNPNFLGIDFGTSGARCFVIDEKGSTITSIKTTYSSSLPEKRASSWKDAIFTLISEIPLDIKSNIASIAIDGTSATALLVDSQSGELLSVPKMYNEAQGADIVNLVKEIATPDHTVTSSTSTFCKLMTWYEDKTIEKAFQQGKNPLLVHQADWLASLLHGKLGYSDWNNALKLGYDPENEKYPEWILKADSQHVLPHNNMVLAPGTPLSKILPSIAKKEGIPEECIVCAGTTDSIAAFLAAGVTQPGQAVTSLGSTLAIKLLSTTRADNAQFGVYSHRLGDTWLVGGASNTGCAVLRRYFTDDELVELTPRMNPSLPTGLNYIVLPSQGERFPVNDPYVMPCLEPRPEDDALFLQGMLECMSETEARAYKVLKELGASAVIEVKTAGGGSANRVWEELRQNALGVPVSKAENGEAAYGAALLAKQGYERSLQEN